MKKLSLQSKQHGISLIEIVLVVVVLGLVATPFANSFIAISRSFIFNDEVLVSHANAQSCAEHMIYFRRSTDPSQGYGNLTNTVCAALPGVSVTLIDASAQAYCDSSDCIHATIDANAGGPTRITMQILFAN